MLAAKAARDKAMALAQDKAVCCLAPKENLAGVPDRGAT
jgi:hypothetical protein